MGNHKLWKLGLIFFNMIFKILYNKMKQYMISSDFLCLHLKYFRYGTLIVIYDS